MNKGIILLLAVLLFASYFLLPNLAHAQEVIYTEFSSNLFSKSLGTAGVATPHQYFKPQNNSISGADLWLDNPGSAGTLSVELRRVDTGALLASRSVSVPYIAGTWGGKQFHIAFSSPVNVVGSEEYRLTLTNAPPALRLYYLNLVDVREHSSTYSLNDSVLPARLGSVEQDFAFKFALYKIGEGDTTPPSLTNVSSSASSSVQTHITFNASEPVDFQVRYGPAGQTLTTGKAFSGNYSSCATGNPPCKATLSTVAGTNYDYEITARDTAGNESVRTGAFTSPPPEEELAMFGLQVSSITHNSALFSWTTNIAANSSVLLRADEPGFPAVLSIGDTTFELEHAIDTGETLNPSSGYIAEVSSFDTEGIQVTQQIGFSTLAPPPPPPPAPPAPPAPPPAEEDETSEESGSETSGTEEGITVSVEEGGGGSSATLDWDDAEGVTSGSSGGYRIDIFDANNNLVTSVFSDTSDVTVDGLGPGTYRAIVYENKNNGVFEKVADPKEFEIGEGGIGWRLYTILGGGVAMGALVAVFLLLRKRQAGKSSKGRAGGFTLIEIVIGTALLVLGTLFISSFGRDIFGFSLDFSQRLQVEQEIDLTVQGMIREMRSVASSNLGSYPIAEAGTSTLTFYTDLEDDGLAEQIRYFLEGTTLKRGVIVPSGDPLQYDPAGEVVNDVVHNIVTGASGIFSYYDETFTGVGDPLAQPVTISDIRMFEVFLSAQETGQSQPLEFRFRITPRNLRSYSTQGGSGGGGGGGGEPTEADSLAIDVTGAQLKGKDKLKGINFENVGETDITIDTVTITWTNSQLIEEFTVKGTKIWVYDGAGSPDGKQPSGTELDVTDHVIPKTTTQKVEAEFDANMGTVTMTITVKMSDGSTKSSGNFTPS